MGIASIVMFALALILAVLMTPLVQRLAWRWNILDRPSSARKLHTQPTPLLGGWAIGCSWVAALLMGTLLLPLPPIISSSMRAIIAGTMLTLVIGTLDERYTLKAPTQLLLAMVPAILLIASGVRIANVRLLDGQLWTLPLLLSVIATLGWMMVIMMSMKILDGLDGLVSGMGSIAALVIAGVSILPQLQQPSMVLIALAFAGSCAGFLFYNWHPATIFLGESGSLLIGFVLAALSILSGTKMVTLLTVLAVPLFDAGWVIARRVLLERRSPLVADRMHLHHRLLGLGLSHRQSVLLLWFIAVMGGIMGVVLQTTQKIIFLIILYILLFAGALSLMMWQYRARAPVDRPPSK